MKVLWLLDFLPACMSQALGLAPQSSGSWASALQNALTGLSVDLVICSYTPQVAQAERRTIDGTVYIALPSAANGDSLKEVLAVEQPDLAQLFGTENDHNLRLFECFAPQRILVYLQGIATPCGEHMADGLPDGLRRRQPLKEALALRTGGATVRQQVERLLRRGRQEEQVLQKALHVLGRTHWDKEYCAAHAPAAQYHHLGEIMRAPFYAGGWQHESCSPHRLFISQAHLPLKGLHWAIEALPALAEAYPDTQLYVAGWPPPDRGPLLRPALNWLAEYPGYLYKLARRLGVADHIHYTGVLDAEGMKQQFLQCETFLLCSSIENSPNSLGEAMLMAVPCAASAVGGVPSMLTHGREGLLFDPAVPGQLADAVLRLWTDPGKAAVLGKAARARALKTHDSAAIAHDLLAIYRQVLKQTEV